jgi:hypothetical protein
VVRAARAVAAVEVVIATVRDPVEVWDRVEVWGDQVEAWDPPWEPVAVPAATVAVARVAAAARVAALWDRRRRSWQTVAVRAVRLLRLVPLLPPAWQLHNFCKRYTPFPSLRFS